MMCQPSPHWHCRVTLVLSISLLLSPSEETKKSYYVILCTDGGQNTVKRLPGQPRGGCEKRLQVYREHKAYQAAIDTADPNSPIYVKKISAGPRVNDDDTMVIGSAFLVEASSREQAETFYKNDPFYKHKVWQSVVCNRYTVVGGILPSLLDDSNG